MSIIILKSRRRFLQAASASAAMFTTAGLFAEELSRTPPQTEGPFYPDRLPLDTDNDLLVLNNKITPATGQVTHLTGRVLTASGQPLRNAVVEAWQCDNNGVYLHSRSASRQKYDTNFQGFGRFLTNSKGEYYFRTIKPVPYPGRTPHIHMLVNHGGKRLLTTQLYVKGEAMNRRDGVLMRLPEKHRNLLTVDFKPIKGSRINELAANFDMVVGATPQDR